MKNAVIAILGRYVRDNSIEIGLALLNIANSILIKHQNGDVNTKFKEELESCCYVVKFIYICNNN